MSVTILRWKGGVTIYTDADADAEVRSGSTVCAGPAPGPDTPDLPFGLSLSPRQR